MDYVYYKLAQQQHSDIWQTPNALKSDIQVNKQEWLEEEIILPCGNGSERQKWAFSWEKYVQYKLRRAKAA